MKDSAEEKRRNRLRELAAKLKADKDSSLVRVLGWASLRWGSKSVRVREHLQDLERVRVTQLARAGPPENAGLIEVNEKEDSITWVGE